MAAFNKSTHVVIMAGGSGTRFWPKSTSKKPKQLLSFGDSGQSLLVQTLKRFDQKLPQENLWIATTKSLEAAVKKDIAAHGLSKVRILAEPEARNTAPCIFWAAKEIQKVDANAVMAVLPSDHYLARPQDFVNTLAHAVEYAAVNDEIVTLGVKPYKPETGFGYLKLTEALTSANQAGVKKVAAFVEKPDLKRAEQFVMSGQYLWNGGMFVWKMSTVFKAFEQWMPEMQKIWQANDQKVELAYSKLTANSIDYGVMEKSQNVVTYVLDCGWDDLGSWPSLEAVASVLKAERPEGVVISGDLLSVEAVGNVIDVGSKKLALLGVNDLIIVEQNGVLMIAHKDRAQDIKKLVDAAKKSWPETV